MVVVVGMLVGICVAGAVVLVIIGVLIFVYCKFCKKDTAKNM